MMKPTVRLNGGGIALTTLAAACTASMLTPGAALAGTLDQQQTEAVPGYALWSNESLAQTFTAGLSGGVDQVDLHLSTTGGTPGAPLNVEIRNVNAGSPGSNILAGSVVPASSVPATGAFVSINFATPAPVVAGTQYAIVADSTVSSGSIYLWSHSSTVNPYPGGTGFFASPPSGPWAPLAANYDLAFKTYVVVPATTTPPTGKRAAALKKCKKKHSKNARKKCRKKAQLLPV